MTVFAVVSLKGGVGKTTTAVYLASVAARREMPALIADANPDGSAASWVEAAKDPGWMDGVMVLEAPSERLLEKALEAPSPPEEVITVDTPPNNVVLTQLAIERSDAVIVATRAGGIEIDRVVATLRLIPEQKPRGIVVSAAITGSRGLADTVAGWEAAGVPVWGVVPHRVGIAASSTAPLHSTGLVVYGQVLDRALTAAGVGVTQ